MKTSTWIWPAPSTSPEPDLMIHCSDGVQTERTEGLTRSHENRSETARHPSTVHQKIWTAAHARHILVSVGKERICPYLLMFDR